MARFSTKLGCRFLRDMEMRLFLIAIVTLSLGAAETLAQTIPLCPPLSPASSTDADFLPTLRLLPSATPAGISPQRQSPSRPQSRQNTYDRAVADCMQMWDAGTHMTKQEWSRSCRRVQTRLDNLNLDAIMPNTKTHVR